MKRIWLVGIIATTAGTGAMAHGHILISNYLVPPYNQVIWDVSIPTIGGGALNDDSARIQIWYGEGTLTDESQLLPGLSFFVNPSLNYDPGAGHGAGGYFDPQLQVLPTWQPGDVFTFQLRLYWPKPTYDKFLGESILWTEQSQIVSTSDEAQVAAFVPSAVVQVPEPSTFALAGLGIGAAVLLQRGTRRSGPCILSG